MKNDRILSLLGMAIMSGNLVSGEFMTEKAVKGRKAHLVIVSEEASDNTKKKFSNMCSFYEVPLYFYETMEELGHCIGKTFRASLAVTSEGLAKSIISKLECGQ